MLIRYPRRVTVNCKKPEKKYSYLHIYNHSIIKELQREITLIALAPSS